MPGEKKMGEVRTEGSQRSIRNILRAINVHSLDRDDDFMVVYIC